MKVICERNDKSVEKKINWKGNTRGDKTTQAKVRKNIIKKK